MAASAHRWNALMLKTFAALLSMMGSAVLLYAAGTGAGGTAVTVHAPSWITASL